MNDFPPFDIADRLLEIVVGALDLVAAAERERAIAAAERDVWRVAHERLVMALTASAATGSDWAVGALSRYQAQKVAAQAAAEAVTPLSRWTPEQRAAQSARIKAAWERKRHGTTDSPDVARGGGVPRDAVGGNGHGPAHASARDGAHRLGPDGI